MEITLMQGIGLAIMAIIVGVDFWLEGLFIFRPIIVSTLTGLILGDVQLGLLTGGITELAFAGLYSGRRNTASEPGSGRRYVYGYCIHDQDRGFRCNGFGIAF